MNEQAMYNEVVERLNTCGYLVLTDGQGYFVQCVRNFDKGSEVETLTDLLQIASTLELGDHAQPTQPVPPR